jgi:hypothetical protein
LDAVDASAALPRSRALLTTPITTKATCGVLKRGWSRPSGAGKAPSAAAVAATRLTPRLQVTMLAMQA